MIVSLLHLSDIHLSGARDAILRNAPYIAAAIRDGLVGTQHMFLVASGDIAYSGTVDQYAAAEVFLNSICAGLKPILREVPISLITCPGNHDCDFSDKDDAELRERLLSTLAGTLDLASAGRTAEEIIKPQLNYFSFAEKLSKTRIINISEKFVKKWFFEISGKHVIIRSINTAWGSRKHEEQGTLFFPLDQLMHENDQSDYSVTLFHHPYNWLESDNKIRFKEAVDRLSDLVITGHEHTIGHSTIAKSTGHHFEYLEGGCLQKKSTLLGNSQFNLVQINLQNRTQKITQFTWDSDLYQPAVTRDWSPFQRSKNIERNKFIFSRQAIDLLTDLGMPVVHPITGNLNLEKIFIFPYLKRMDIGIAKPKAQASQRLEQIHEDKASEFIRNNHYVTFMGEEKSGKTCLAKKLALVAHAIGIIPVLVNARNFNGAEPAKNTDKVIEAAFKEQYSKELYQHFIQLDLDKRLIIIDDFTKAECNSKSRAEIISHLKKTYERIFVFGGDLFQLEEVFGPQQINHPLNDFIACSIAEFGHYHREELVRKWVVLGQEQTLDSADIDHACKRLIRTIDSILGKNVIPSYPVFILSILQTSDSTAVTQVNHGSYGYFFEALLTGLLKTDIGLKYKLLAEIAYFMFTNGKETLSDGELDKICQSYHTDYGARITRLAIVASLCDSNVLQETDQGVRFRYRYGRYYFTARYISTALQENLPGNSAQADILILSKSLHRDDYSNTMLFLNYLSRDPQIVKAVLDNASKLYQDFEMCRLEEDTEFANKICISVPSVGLIDSSGDELRQRELQLRDFSDEVRYEEDDPSLESSFEEIRRLNNAFKTIKIMGQTVRNFADTTRAQVKIEIVRQCFSLGLRTLRAVTQMFETHMEKTKAELYQLAVLRFPSLKPEEARGSVDKFLYFLLQMVTYGIIKTVSHAVGSEKLGDTYRDVLASGLDFNSAKFIDLSIRMDHLRNIPSGEIHDMYESIKDHEFNLNLLRTFVVEHFTLYHCKESIRNEVCAKLGITTEKKFISGPLKK